MHVEVSLADAKQNAQNRVVRLSKGFSSPSKHFRLEHGQSPFETEHEADTPSGAFEVKATPEGVESQIQDGLAALDKVQKWPDDLEQIPIYQVQKSAGAFGGFHHENGKAKGITINTNGPHARLTTVHEVGHRFDFDVVGQRGTFESENAEDPKSVLHEWWKAVSNSKRHQNLVETLGDPLYDGDVKEFLKKRELFARSFAQYVARKSGHAEIQGELTELQNSYGMDSYRQWEDDDFAKVEVAFDKLLTKLGMMP